MCSRDGERGHPAVSRGRPGPPPHPYRFEAEAEWPPPFRQTGGTIRAFVFAHGTCALGRAGLLVVAKRTRASFRTARFRFRRRKGHVSPRRPRRLAWRCDRSFRSSERRDAPPLATWTFSTIAAISTALPLTEEFVNLTDARVARSDRTRRQQALHRCHRTRTRRPIATTR